MTAPSHVMIDLETLSTKPNAIILTVAAVRFDPTDFKSLNDTPASKFYMKVDLNSYNGRSDFHTDYNSLVWWMKQSEPARQDAFLGTTTERVPIHKCLTDLKKWFVDDRSMVWGHGSCFDIPVLASAFQSCGLVEPWKFWNVRDTRTIYDLGKVDFKNVELPEGMVAHNALADCYRQIKGVKMAYKNLGLSKN